MNFVKELIEVMPGDGRPVREFVTVEAALEEAKVLSFMSEHPTYVKVGGKICAVVKGGDMRQP